MSNKKQSFMGNVLIILFAQIMVKLLGIVYRLVITNVSGFGDAGNGYYSAGFQIYTLLLAISSVGIPNAISKMTSEKNAIGDYKGAHTIYKNALILFSIIGAFSSLLLFVFSSTISTYVINMPNAKYVLMALSPSIFFVCISSVVRGYFAGMQDMRASSRSQIIEQLFKCGLTIAIVLLMSKFLSLKSTLTADKNAAFLAAGANLATTLATVFSTAYIFIFYFVRRKDIKSKVSQTTIVNEKKSKLSSFKSILLISIPISLGSIIAAINRIVDTATITRGIEIAFKENIPAIFGNAQSILSPTIEQLSNEAVRLAGILAKSDTLLNLPISMNIAFATVLVPSISAALAKGEKKEASKFVSYSFLISLLIIFPCAAGFVSLAEPIFKLLYPTVPYGYQLLQLSSIALIFIALNQTISGSLQGIGKVYAPATGLLLGCIAKFILNVILIRIPSINIYGAPISSIACQVISFTYGFSILKNQISLKLDLKKYIIKPLLCAFTMGIIAFLSYRIVFVITNINIIAVSVSIILSVLSYFSLIFKTNTLNKDDINMLPMGDKLYRISRKLHLSK